MDVETSRRCPVCDEMKPPSEFGWRDRAHTRKQSYCRQCMRAAWRDWYSDAENRARHITSVATRRRRRIVRLRELVRQAKSGPCVDCGHTYPPEVMDFDHVRGTKVGDISQLVFTAGEQTVRDELAKCEAVCSNCHRLRTLRRSLEAEGGDRG